MRLTASTVAAILAFTMAGAGALPSPQQSTTLDTVAATQTAAAAPVDVTTEAPVDAPDTESIPVYYPEGDSYFEKRWTPSNNRGQNQGPRGAVGHDPAQGHGMPPQWQHGVQGGNDGAHHPYHGQHGGPGGMGFNSRGSHGPMPEADSFDDYDDEEDEEDAHVARLARRAIHMKQYKWWQYQTTKPVMGLVTGNPNIRNLNFKQQSRTLGMGLRRRDAEPLPALHNKFRHPMARPLVPTRYRDPMGPHNSGPLPDDVEDDHYYYYPYEEEN